MAARARFNLNRSYVVARDFTFEGHDFKVGDPFPPADGSIEVSARLLERQYSSRAINMVPLDEAPADPAATENPDPITIETQPGGYYLISAPWLDAPERVRGKAAMTEMADKMRAEGEPATHHGVTVQQNADGVWEVIAEWDPENIAASTDEASARELAAKWREEGEPAPADDEPGVDVTVTEEDGKFIVRAAWLDDAETFDDEDAANTRATELLAEDAKAAEEAKALAETGDGDQQGDGAAGDQQGEQDAEPSADEE